MKQRIQMELKPTDINKSVEYQANHRTNKIEILMKNINRFLFFLYIPLPYYTYPFHLAIINRADGIYTHTHARTCGINTIGKL